METQGATRWDREADLVVMGAGAGGMAAALVASLQGLAPLVVEKTAQAGGTAATSAGTIWIPGNRPSAAAGHADSAEAAAGYLDRLIGAPDTTGVRAAYLAAGPDMVDYLNTHTEVRFLPSGKHPDYQDLPGAAVHGRTLYPAPFDGRLLGRDFARVRPPIPEFLLFGGMMVGKSDLPPLIGRFRSPANFAHAARLLLRYAADRLRYPRGTRVVMGNALVARLLYSLRQRHVPVLFDSTVDDVVVQDGRVVGVVLRSGGAVQRVRTRRGLVIATGGFGHDAALRTRFMPAPTPRHTVAAPGNTGDGIALALRAGGALSDLPQGPGAFWTPVSVTRRADGSQGVFPHLLLDRAKPGLIAVNAAGQRFVNEADSYHDFVQGMFAAHRLAPSIPAFLLCNADFVRRYGLGQIHPGTRALRPFERSGYIHTAPDLAGLAGRIGVDAQALQATVQRYNVHARTGHDPAFGKGGSELNRFNGDPDHGPNPCLAPIECGPYVALQVWPAEIATSAGLRTDADARVLDAQGQAVPGLYAVGNDMASIMQGTYPGPGTTLGPALTFGYRAALHAAGRPAAHSSTAPHHG